MSWKKKKKKIAEKIALKSRSNRFDILESRGSTDNRVK